MLVETFHRTIEDGNEDHPEQAARAQRERLVFEDQQGRKVYVVTRITGEKPAELLVGDSLSL